MRRNVKMLMSLINECYNNDYELFVLNGSTRMFTYDFTYWKENEELEIDYDGEVYLIHIDNIKDMTIDNKNHIRIELIKEI